MPNFPEPLKKIFSENIFFTIFVFLLKDLPLYFDFYCISGPHNIILHTMDTTTVKM